jgi:hypothetical protein
MRLAPPTWWMLLFVPLSFPPLLDKMIDDEATNEQDDEGSNAENLIPHLSVPSFSVSWALRLSALLLLVSYHRWFIPEVNVIPH